MKFKCDMRQGCQLQVVEAVSKGKGPSLDQCPISLNYKYVFSKQLTGLPPQRDLDFTIELKPGVELISKTPYSMTTPKLCELQM